MGRTFHVTEKPVELEGYQAILKPSQYGHSLSAVVTNEVIKPLETERVEVLKWAESKLRNPRRSVLKPTPWEQLQPNTYKIKFSWKERKEVFVINSQGDEIEDTNAPLYSSSLVRLIFCQRPYILEDQSYGTRLVLKAVLVVKTSEPVKPEGDDLTLEDVRKMFGL